MGSSPTPSAQFGVVMLLDWSERVVALLLPHPLVDDVRLTGSRARGDAGPLSDWDFELDVADFSAFKPEVWRLVDELRPLVKQWDRLGEPWTLMLIVEGAVKIDLIFDEPHEDEPPWNATAENLQGIDDHFWDWILWLGSKVAKVKDEFVSAELEKMHGHLLGPLGVTETSGDVGAAINRYLEARNRAEQSLRTRVDRRLEREVVNRLIDATVIEGL